MTSASPADQPSRPRKPSLTRADHIRIELISVLASWIIRVVGATLRWEVSGMEHINRLKTAGKSIIGAFWHGRVFMATYFFRNWGFVIMTSRHRDGEYIARVIRRLGYGAARGSSTRGARGALQDMLQVLKNGGDVAFTIDGPRGPRYVAKPGAAYLAWKTGNAVITFNISAQRKWVLKSWDHFQIPKPFTKVFLLVGEPIYVSPGASEEEIRAAEARIQVSLDDLRERSDSRWAIRPTA